MGKYIKFTWKRYFLTYNILKTKFEKFYYVETSYQGQTALVISHLSSIITEGKVGEGRGRKGE